MIPPQRGDFEGELARVSIGTLLHVDVFNH